MHEYCIIIPGLWFYNKSTICPWSSQSTIIIEPSSDAKNYHSAGMYAKMKDSRQAALLEISTWLWTRWHCQFHTHSNISTLKYFLLTSSFQVGHVSSSTIACINTGSINTALFMLAHELMTDQQFLSMVLTNYIHNQNFCLHKKVQFSWNVCPQLRITLRHSH